MELDNTQAFKANMICDGQINTPKHEMLAIPLIL